MVRKDRAGGLFKSCLAGSRKLRQFAGWYTPTHAIKKGTKAVRNTRKEKGIPLSGREKRSLIFVYRQDLDLNPLVAFSALQGFIRVHGIALSVALVLYLFAWDSLVDQVVGY